MIELPETPLEDYFAGQADGPTILLKREDLLPYGGGNKVRRFLPWLQERTEQAEAGQARERTIAAFSDAGSHTFAVLVRMLDAHVEGLARVVFYERARPSTPYVEQIRRTYADHPRVQVVRGPTAWLLLRWQLARWRAGSQWRATGIGGDVRTAAPAYRDVLDECQRQLAAKRFAGRRVWHLLPIASGNMADGFRRVFGERGWTNHRVLGVLTGPPIARARARLRYRKADDVVLLAAGSLFWDEYEAEAAMFFRQTGVWLDPVHTIHTGRLLRNLPPCVAAEDVVVGWITCPAARMGEPPSAIASSP